MALAGIDALLIQASYSQQPAESRCLGPWWEDGRGLRQGTAIRVGLCSAVDHQLCH